jgi:isoquinoline 1-oxidoreductase subunit alpha
MHVSEITSEFFFVPFKKETPMPSYTLTVNGVRHTVEAESDMPLLWVLRDLIGLTGTKYGCGISACGACTVLVNNRAIRSCSFPVSSAQGRNITTIESLAKDTLHPVQQAWEEVNVPQCGYCQSGQIMAVADMLNRSKRPTEEEINATMSQILCRCGTYTRIRKAIHLAIEKVNS